MHVQRCDGCFIYGMADDDAMAARGMAMEMLHMSMGMCSPASMHIAWNAIWRKIHVSYVLQI